MAPANKGRRFPPEPLTAVEVRALISACGRGPAGMRNRALIVLLWRSGLRCAEALALELKDLDLDAGTVTVLHGKGDKRRTVGIDPEACAVIREWMVLRRRLGIGPRGPVFCTITRPGAGAPVGSPYVRDLLKRLAWKAQIDKRVHPHGLRHTHAFELTNEGVPLGIIQRQLGHTNLSVTARYLDHFAPVQVISAMRARTWAVTEHDRGAPQPPAGRPTA